MYGPVGDSGTVTSNFSMAAADITGSMGLADLNQDDDLARTVAEAALVSPPTE